MRAPNIRFNLTFFDEKGNAVAIRTLDDLRANLNLSDLWDYFKAGDLERWVRGLGEATKAASLTALRERGDDIQKALTNICSLLALSVPAEDIVRFADMEARRRERAAQPKLQEEPPVVESYLALVRDLLAKRNDIFVTVEVVNKMIKYYPDSFIRDFEKLVQLELVYFLSTYFDKHLSFILLRSEITGDRDHGFSCTNSSINAFEWRRTLPWKEVNRLPFSTFLEIGLRKGGDCRRTVRSNSQFKHVLLLFKVGVIEKLRELDKDHNFTFGEDEDRR